MIPKAELQPNTPRHRSDRAFSTKSKRYLRENQPFRKVFGADPGHALPAACDDRDRRAISRRLVNADKT
jgi:hypothetical protein